MADDQTAPVSGTRPALFALARWAPVHYGAAVVELGDDGDMYAVFDAANSRRAFAAVHCYLRVTCGLEEWDRANLAHATQSERWVAVDPSPVDEEHEWLWFDEPRVGAVPVRVVSL